jgi:hypothetical protein
MLFNTWGFTVNRFAVITRWCIPRLTAFACTIWAFLSLQFLSLSFWHGWILAYYCSFNINGKRVWSAQYFFSNIILFFLFFCLLMPIFISIYFDLFICIYLIRRRFFIDVFMICFDFLSDAQEFISEFFATVFFKDIDFRMKLLLCFVDRHLGMLILTL